MWAEGVSNQTAEEAKSDEEAKKKHKKHVAHLAIKASSNVMALLV